VKALLLAAAVAGFVVPDASFAWHECPPISGCGFHECNLGSTTDPNPEAPENTQTGFLSGGPYPENGTLTCTVQVGGGLHTDADNGAKASATGTNGVTFLNPTLVSYNAPPNTNIYLCDQFTNASNVTYVYDDTDGEWEPAAGNYGATCRLTLSAGTDDPLFQGIFEAVDGIACPVLATTGSTGLADVPGVVSVRSDGDVELLGDDAWTCPPYES